jgi:hypothetical protein
MYHGNQLGIVDGTKHSRSRFLPDEPVLCLANFRVADENEAAGAADATAYSFD